MFVMPQLMTARQLVTDGGDKPNIIFILADDMGYCDLSCYGNKYIETPNIDRLAATGTAFTQCYAGSGISSPSRCALMTGKNTGNTTIRDNFCIAGGIEGLKGTKTIRRMHLQPNDTTIATVLGAAGYRTCLVNKWHLDGFNPEATPLNRGFDEFYGWLISTAYSNDPYYYPYWRFNNEKLENVKENEGDKHIKHNTDLSTEDAIKFINRNKNNPFFLYLAYDAPHEPYNIDETTWYDDEAWDMNTKRYASLITHMDRAIGRLLAELDRLGLRENTLRRKIFCPGRLDKLAYHANYQYSNKNTAINKCPHNPSTFLWLFIYLLFFHHNMLPPNKVPPNKRFINPRTANLPSTIPAMMRTNIIISLLGISVIFSFLSFVY